MNTGHEEELWNAYYDGLEKADRTLDSIKRIFRIVVFIALACCVVAGLSYLLYCYVDRLIDLYHENREAFDTRIRVLLISVISFSVVNGLVLRKGRD